MSTLNSLIKCAENKLFQIETELYLLHKQLDIISQIPGISEIESNCIMLEYNINFVKRKYLLIYLNSLKEKFKEKCNFNESIMIHISSLDENLISSFLLEISGHQNALSDVTDTTLFNNNGKPESILMCVKRFFPYEIIFPLIQNNQFMTKILKIVFDDSRNDLNKMVKDVLSLFSFNKNNIYIFVIVSEVLVSYFRPNIARNQKQLIDDFAFYERCQILMKEDLSILEVFKNIEFEYKPKSDEESQYSVRSFSKEIERPLPFDSNLIEKNDKKIFQHVVYELQKISVQSSYSMICLSFLRISDFLTMIISALKKESFIGADETFHILIYIICSSRIMNLLSILDFVDKNCPSFMTESKIGYLIEQMKSATNFINSMSLSSNNKNNKIILPFLFQEGASKILLNESIEIVFYPNETVPAIYAVSDHLKENNKAIGYAQNFDENLFNQLKDVTLINTSLGLIPIYSGTQNYQKLDDNDYEKYIASMF